MIFEIKPKIKAFLGSCQKRRLGSCPVCAEACARFPRGGSSMRVYAFVCILYVSAAYRVCMICVNPMTLYEND